MGSWVQDIVFSEKGCVVAVRLIDELDRNSSALVDPGHKRNNSVLQAPIRPASLDVALG